MIDVVQLVRAIDLGELCGKMPQGIIPSARNELRVCECSCLCGKMQLTGKREKGLARSGVGKIWSFPLGGPEYLELLKIPLYFYHFCTTRITLILSTFIALIQET